jgi:hypothetical protein
VIDKNEPVEWTSPEHTQPHKGLFKVFLLPPDDLYLPVIAEKIHGKLVISIIFLFFVLLCRFFISAIVVPSMLPTKRRSNWTIHTHATGAKTNVSIPMPNEDSCAPSLVWSWNWHLREATE